MACRACRGRSVDRKSAPCATGVLHSNDIDVTYVSDGAGVAFFALVSARRGPWPLFPLTTTACSSSIRSTREPSMRQTFQALLALFGVIVIGISRAHFRDRPPSDHRRHGCEPDDGRRGPLLRRPAAVQWCGAVVVRTRRAAQARVRQPVGRRDGAPRRRAEIRCRYTKLGFACPNPDLDRRRRSRQIRHRIAEALGRGAHGGHIGACPQHVT